MRRIVGFILGIIMLFGMFEIYMQTTVYARTIIIEDGAAISNIDDETDLIEIRDELDKKSDEPKKNNNIGTWMLQSLAVLDKPEESSVGIKRSPSLRAEIIGEVYGSLAEVKILKTKSRYAYIEAVDYTTGKKIKGYVGQAIIKKRTPQKPYCIVADISDQRVYIYKNGLKIKEMICSTGRTDAATPTGLYLIGERGKSFYSSKYKQGAHNWVRFNNDFLFHSVPFDSEGKIIPSEKKKLGQKASHGCIRLSVEDSNWFFNTIPEGTAVLIQE